jgi:hypothetical protein
MTPVVLETWELYGCYLSGADYGALNYSETKLQCQLNYEHCVRQRQPNT